LCFLLCEHYRLDEISLICCMNQQKKLLLFTMSTFCFGLVRSHFCTLVCLHVYQFCMVYFVLFDITCEAIWQMFHNGDLCFWQVLEILSHVNKRVKLQPQIGLPLSELWKLYSGSSAVPIIRNFCIVYIEMAFQRVNAKVSCSLYLSACLLLLFCGFYVNFDADNSFFDTWLNFQK